MICIDKGCLVNSIFNYPANMIFFTTPELLEIGDLPFSSRESRSLIGWRPSSTTAKRQSITSSMFASTRRVETVIGEDNNFHITTCDRLGSVFDYVCRKVIVATGYYDRANLLRVPGEDLPKVLSLLSRAPSLLR